MSVKTHKRANKKLIGKPIMLRGGKEAAVELVASLEMAVDDEGLIHGGFIFGVADYAAMLAINHPYVVLGGSRSKFIAPVKVGELMRAEATVSSIDGRKWVVDVGVTVESRVVYTGTMTCFVLDRHVLCRD